MLVLPFISTGHTPLRIFFAQKLLHALSLLIFIDLHEKFQYKISIIGQLAFKSADTFNSFFIQITFQITGENIHDTLLHPARIEECKFAFFRDLFHITIQKRSAQFFLCRRGHRCNFEKTRINIFDHFADHTAFTCRAPSFKKNQHRQLMLLDLHLEIIQTAFRFFKLYFHFFPVRHFARRP